MIEKEKHLSNPNEKSAHKIEKPPILYHGSAVEIIGEELEARTPTDLGNNPNNLHTAVYATDIKEKAIIKAIINSRGVISSSVDFGRKSSPGIIYEGWPDEDAEIYLYTLPSDTFINSEPHSSQWHSVQNVKPIKVEKLKVKDFLHLIRKATPDEIEEWNKKYRTKNRLKSPGNN